MTRVVVLPGTALLTPGAAGRTTVLEEARSEALDALSSLVRSVEEILVIAPGPTSRRGRFRASLGAAGVDDGLLGWHERGGRISAGCKPVTAGIAASTAILAVRTAGWSRPVEVWELTAAECADLCVPVEPTTGIVLAADDAELVAAVFGSRVSGGLHDEPGVVVPGYPAGP